MTGFLLIPQFGLLLSGLVASFTDVTRRRIPNWLSLLTLLGGLAFAWRDVGLAMAGNHALHMGVALAVGMAAHQVDDDLAVDGEGEARAQFAAILEIGLEGLADAGEAVGAEAGDLDRHFRPVVRCGRWARSA